MICRWKSTGKDCFETAQEGTIFCEDHKDSLRYIGIIYDDETEAERMDKVMRHEHGLACSVWQHRFLIIGPTNMKRLVGLIVKADKPAFEAFYYEEVLEFFIARANLVRLVEQDTLLTIFLHPKQLTCPKCNRRHIDQREEDGKNWAETPHRKHLCHYCGHLWRPFDYNTIGV